MSRYLRISLETWILFGILALTLLLYGVLLSAPALPWDDDSNIFNNPFYRSGQWSVFWKGPYYGLYVPLTTFVWQVLFTLGRGEVWPFRVLNLTLHSANVFLVFLILRRWSQHLKVPSVWPLGASVMLFAWHPLQVESVAWISGGRDLLSAFFALLALVFYARDEKWNSYALATFLFVAALLSKPGAVVWPAVCFGVDLLTRPERLRVLWPRLAAWLPVSAVIMLMTERAQVEHLVPVDWWLRPWVMLDTYAFYLRKIIWPIGLAGNYGRTPEIVLGAPRTLFVGLGFAVALIALSVWALRRRERALLTPWLWVILLLPVSGLVSFGYQRNSTTADHYSYLAMVVVGAMVLAVLAGDLGRSRVLRGISALMVIGFFALAWQRVQVWRSAESFFRDMAETSPHSYATAIGMSVVECHERQDYDQGILWTERALLQRPHDITALANQAYCLIHAKNFFRVRDLDDELDHLDLEEMEAKNPTAYSSLLASIGTALMELTEYEDGYPYLCEAYRIKPSEPSYQRNLEIGARLMHEHDLDANCPE